MTRKHALECLGARRANGGGSKDRWKNARHGPEWPEKLLRGNPFGRQVHQERGSDSMVLSVESKDETAISVEI